MTEAFHPANVPASSHRPPLVPVENGSSDREAAPVSLVAEETQEEDDGEIACICAYTGDDGATIQCDACLRWQHISCYYPDPAQVPLEDQKHYCTDCFPQPGLDSRRATELQRCNLEQPSGSPGLKKSMAKGSKKKSKESPSLHAQPNGWSHLQAHDRKSASPRDQPPPAKKPKTSHRSSNSVSHATGRKRAGTTTIHRSPSRSPELNMSTFIPHYSHDFMSLFQSDSPQVETDTNLMNNIAVTNSLSDWLVDPEAVGKVTGGLTQSEIFKRWDGRIEDIPGRPEVSVEWVEDARFAIEGVVPRWARLDVNNQIAQGTLIGELRGRVGHRDEYLHETDGRWRSLHHPEPFVFFHPQLPIYIDARQEGSTLRFVRRSCQPNAELQTIITEGTEYHFCFMAKKDIMAGEEVTLAWQVPDTIRDRINSSLATSNNFQPKVRDYISTWVSNVLANCGPCACNGQSSCLMAHYDRRGLDPPLPAAKSTRRKKKIPVLDAAVPSRSRSASEIRKVEHDDVEADSRSTSDSRASASRDMTPSMHIPGGAAGSLHELSEREKKKLMREEEMFRRQAEESGRQKKKRSSGGSTLIIPGAIPSNHAGQAHPSPTTERMGQRSINGVPKYVDAAISTRFPPSSRSLSGKRKSAATRTLRADISATTRIRLEAYVDVGVQCDRDEDDARARRGTAVPQRRRYLSITQRLLARCSLNRPDGATPPSVLSDDTETSKRDAEPMVVDSDANAVGGASFEARPVASGPAIDGVDGPATLTTIARDEVMPDLPQVEAAEPDPVKPDPVKPDSVKPDPIKPDPVKPESVKPDLRHVADTSPPILNNHVVIGTQDNGDAGEPVELATMADNPPAASNLAESIEPPVPVAALSHSHRPTMHLEMPPPSLAMANSSSRPLTTPSLILSQSPTTMTPGSLPGPLFSPSVTSAISPSPMRKKMSLSDYTKRSRAKETTEERAAPPSNLGLLGRDANDQDDEASDTALVATPSPSREVARVEQVAQDDAMLADGDAAAPAVVEEPQEGDSILATSAVPAAGTVGGDSTATDVSHAPVAALVSVEGPSAGITS